MNPAVECAERGDYKGLWEACGMFSEDLLTSYWKATYLSFGDEYEQVIAKENLLSDEMSSSILALAEQGNVFVLVDGDKTESPNYFRNIWTNELNFVVEYEYYKIADLLTKVEKPEETLC